MVGNISQACNRMQPILNEEELIARAQNGDKQAIGKLYEAYARPIFQYLTYRVETDAIAEDMLGEVFLKMLRGIKSYRYTGAPLGAWLFRVAANQVADHYRQRAKLRESELTDQLGSDSMSPLDEIIHNEERQRIRTALQTLPEDYQNVLVLRFMQDVSHATVAEVMERSESAVRVLQHRALKALQVALTRQNTEDQLRKGGSDNES